MLDIINRILWCLVTSFIILFSFYYTFYLNFIQFNFKNVFKSFKTKNYDKNKLSPFSVLMLTLGGRIGVGSIAGVGLAIYLGGPGTIFWLWFITIISAPISFLESMLGSLFKLENNTDISGPSLYILKGLNNKRLAIIYSLLIIISYLGGFLGIQVNTIVKSLNLFVFINPILIGIIICLITFLIINGGIKKISNVMNKLVPIMLILYLLLMLVIIFNNFAAVVIAIIDIFKSAFNFKSFEYGFLYTFIIGIQRGVFSNESGMGTGSISVSSSGLYNPSHDGYVQMIGSYITGLFVCTITAVIVMISPNKDINIIDPNGIEVTMSAFNYFFNYGTLILTVFICFFAFSTILTGYYYSFVSLKFIKSNFNERVLIAITMVSLFLGSILSSSFLWKMVDLFVAVMVLINLYSIWKLKNIVKTNKKE